MTPRLWLKMLRHSGGGPMPVDAAIAEGRIPTAMKVMGIFERQTKAARQRAGRRASGVKLAQRFAARAGLDESARLDESAKRARRVR